MVSIYSSGNFAASRLDSSQLDIANLGSTPLAQAIARGIDLQVVYISHYMGDSQGIYVRASTPPSDNDSYTSITNPFELRGRTVGVPFGSTMHYQVLFLLDLFGLKGEVTLLNLAPSEIIEAWDAGTIDAAACWGTARDYVLTGGDGSGNGNQESGSGTTFPPANTLMSAGILANWGRPTFVVVAANTKFSEQHPEFMTHFVAILSRLNDSFLDRLGEVNTQNVLRWNNNNAEDQTTTSSSTSSFVPSMVDSLMNENEIPQQPSTKFLTSQRRALDLFLQLSAGEQLSCEYLGRCDHPTLQHIATYQTAEFLLGQKVISNLGVMEEFEYDDEKSLDSNHNCEFSNYCSGSIFDGTYLSLAQQKCNNCYPVGPYSGIFASDLTLLNELERMDVTSSRSIYASNEIGRFGGHSDCTGHAVVEVGSNSAKSFGDGASAVSGRTYSGKFRFLFIFL